MINQLTKPEIQDFIEGHLYDDPSVLMLKANHHPDWPMKLIVEQIQAKRKAKSKLPSWFKTAGIVYPPVLSMEQCSSEYTARYKMKLANEGTQMIDLTGGFGVDFAFLSEKFSKAQYVERQAKLVERAKYNFSLLGLADIKVHHGQSEQFLNSEDKFDLIYLDPARRDGHNEKVVRLKDCEPNVTSLLPKLLSKAKQVMIKTSPLLDIKGAIKELGAVSEVHVLAVSNEVKELIFLLNTNSSKPLIIRCANLKGENQDVFEFSFESEEQSTSNFSQVLEYLYEPNVAILKAGAFKTIGNEFGLKKLHANSHLYTSSQIVAGFPGRTFRVIDKISLNKKLLKNHFPDMKANITVRNFPMTVAQIRKKSGLKEGGDQYLFGSTDQQGKQMVLCEKIDTQKNQ